MQISRFPITAYSIVNGMGHSTQAVEASLESGRTGLCAADLGMPFETWVGLVTDLPALPASLSEWDSRQARLTAATLEDMRKPVADAIARWGADRVAIVMGSSTGGIRETEDAWGQMVADGADALPADYDCLKQHVFAGTIRVLTRLTGIAGPAYMVSTACTSSAKVLGSAQRLLQLGVADAVLTGGVDSMCRFTLAGFKSLQVLSSEKCRPYSSQRQGINIGEGGAFLLLQRDGEPLAWLRGVGETSDAYHMTTPHPEGRGAIAAMEMALHRSGIQPGEVGYINVHGTATHLNDQAEANAIAAVFGPGKKVVATKGYTGHLLGACGATEAAFAIHSMRTRTAPASLGSSPLDPTLPVDVITESSPLAADFVLSNSFAFGGNNVSVVLERGS